MSATWNTKWGTRRVRRDPPTLGEAIAAAEGLTDDREQQVDIAASLMGVDTAAVQTEMKRLMPDRRTKLTMMAPTRDKGARMVVVERKVSRRIAARETLQRPTGGAAHAR